MSDDTHPWKEIGDSMETPRVRVLIREYRHGLMMSLRPLSQSLGNTKRSMLFLRTDVFATHKWQERFAWNRVAEMGNTRHVPQIYEARVPGGTVVLNMPEIEGDVAIFTLVPRAPI